jgi:hypothetical protein
MGQTRARVAAAPARPFATRAQADGTAGNERLTANVAAGAVLAVLLVPEFWVRWSAHHHHHHHDH